MRYRNDTEIKADIIMLIICIIAIFTIHSCGAIMSATTYNDGVHKGCGGHWVYETAIGHQYTTSYIYHCDKCGITVELNDRY